LQAVFEYLILLSLWYPHSPMMVLLKTALSQLQITSLYVQYTVDAAVQSCFMVWWGLPEGSSEEKVK